MLETKNQDASKEPSAEYRAFDDLLKHVLSVPKSELDNREAEYQKTKTKKQSNRKTPILTR